MRDLIHAVAFAAAWRYHRDAPLRIDPPEPGAVVGVRHMHTRETLRELCDREARECVACWESTQ